MESDLGTVDLGPLAPPYRALFERQKAALEALRGENAALSDRNRRLEHQEPVVEDLRAANASLTDRNRHLEDVNRRLEHLIRELRGVVYGKKSEKLDPDQLQLAFEALEGALAEAEPDKLRPILWQLAETVARRMKKAGIAGGSVTLKLKTADFRILTRARRLTTPTQSAEEMFRTAEPLLAREADGRAFRLIGIGAHDLIEADRVVQSDLFGGVAPSEDKVDKALDAVRDKYGDDAIVRGRGFGTKLVRQGPSKVE